MKVYRYLTEEELNKILLKDSSGLGSCYVSTRFIKRLANNFRYQKGEKYLHFFKNKADMKRIRRIRREHDKYFNRDLVYYYCTFDIHPTVLFFAAGKGWYNNYDENGRRTMKTTTVREYAIKTKHFNPDWLIEYVRDDVKNDEHIEVYSRDDTIK